MRRLQHTISALAAGAAALLGACALDSEAPSAESLEEGQQELPLPAALPELPRQLRDVAIVDGNKLNAPALPPLRTSNDGRVAMDMGAGRKFFLFAPEKLTSHFWDSPAGVPALAATAAVSYTGPLHARTGGVSRFAALCDGTGQFNVAGKNNQPHACGENDCYDLSIIAATFNEVSGSDLQLWSTPIRVTVSSPKTATAKIVSVTQRAAPVPGPVFPGVKFFFEPMVTADGHLLVGRVQQSMKDPETKETLDIVYAVHGAGRAACDVTGWTQLRAVSRAPTDPAAQPYGFARFPFRDSEGNAIPPGADLHGTYPWIDRHGRNLFFKSQGSRLIESVGGGQLMARYPFRCISKAGVTCDATLAGTNAVEQGRGVRGTAVIGLWTHGRTVLLDGQTNNTDFGLGVADAHQREIKLYGPVDAPQGWVRVGVGRQGTGDGAPAGMPGNVTFIESLENLFQYRATMRPRTPRDVVWMMNTQMSTEEIAFDDWVDPHALIVSDMVPSWTHKDPVTGSEALRDGFELGVGFSANAPLRMQNAATPPAAVRAVPPYGVVAGPGRAEPVALGGVFGRGLWLYPTTRLSYAIPAQPAPVSGDPWFVSLFFDARHADDTAARRLLSFPDGTSVVLIGRKVVQVRGATGGALASFTLPPALVLGTGYRHLGLRISALGTSVELFVDGQRLGGQTLAAPGALRIRAGQFVVGQRAGDALAGVRGWIDELRVMAEWVTPELACNHARGTLARLDAGAAAALVAQANLFPATSHQAISTALGEAATTRYVCLHDYTARHPSLTAPGTTNVREALLFPEGPLHAAQPRPDSSKNAFCLTCHTPSSPPTLSVAALTPKSAVLMRDDQRRQPMQPPRVMFGHLPANLLGPSLPATPSSNPNGQLLDPLLLP